MVKMGQRRDPAKGKTPLRKVSKKQSKELVKRRQLKKELLAENPNCRECGKAGDFRGLDLVHKIALSQGGKTTRENCTILCRPCHNCLYHGIVENKLRNR